MNMKSKRRDNECVTVITVCRNASSLLDKTQKSVLRQSYKNIEYIIIDGASTDDTIDILNKISAPQVHWTSEPDKGIYDAMNKGIHMAHGKWCIFMNAGDIFADDLVIETIMGQEGIEEAEIIYGDVIKGGDIKKAEKPHNAHRMYFCHQCVFIRTALLKEFPFDINHKMSADFKQMKQLWLAKKRFKQLNIPVAVFDTSGISNSKRAEGLWDNIQVIREVDAISEQFRLLPRLLFTWLVCKLRGR